MRQRVTQSMPVYAQYLKGEHNILANISSQLFCTFHGKPWANFPTTSDSEFVHCFSNTFPLLLQTGLWWLAHQNLQLLSRVIGTLLRQTYGLPM